MSTAKEFLENATNCTELAEAAQDIPTRNRYLRMGKAWLALAEEQAWLDGALPDGTLPTFKSD